MNITNKTIRIAIELGFDFAPFAKDGRYTYEGVCVILMDFLSEKLEYLQVLQQKDSKKEDTGSQKETVSEFLYISEDGTPFKMVNWFWGNGRKIVVS